MIITRAKKERKITARMLSKSFTFRYMRQKCELVNLAKGYEYCQINAKTLSMFPAKKIPPCHLVLSNSPYLSLCVGPEMNSNYFFAGLLGNRPSRPENT